MYEKQYININSFFRFLYLLFFRLYLLFLLFNRLIILLYLITHILNYFNYPFRRIQFLRKLQIQFLLMSFKPNLNLK